MAEVFGNLAHVEAIVNTLHEPLLIVDEDLKVLFANTAFYSKFLVKEEETRGKEIYSLGNGQWNIPDLKKLLAEIIPRKASFNRYEVTHEFPQIGKRTMVLDARELGGGHPGTILVVIEDITEHKEAEDKLRTSEFEYRKLFEAAMEDKAKDEALMASLGDGVIAIDNNGKIILMNPAAETMLGWNRDETIGKMLAETVPTENMEGKRILDKELPIYIVLTTAGTSSTTTFTTHPGYHFVRKDGTRLPVAITVTPFRLDQKIVGAVEVFRDISKEQEIDRQKSEFVSLASHQLRTPITGIQWVTELFLQKEKLTPKGEEYIKDIHGATKKLNLLVTQLLDVSRLEMGRINVIAESLELVGFLNAYLEEHRPLVDKKKLVLKFENHPNTLTITIDRIALRNIVQSIVSNALEYTPQGGEVELSLEKRSKTFVLSIRDTGIGIPKADQQKVFQKFVRGSNAQQMKTDGTGLGLYIATATTKLLGGKIWFESEEGRGSTFYLELPIQGEMRSGETRFVERKDS